MKIKLIIKNDFDEICNIGRNTGFGTIFVRR